MVRSPDYTAASVRGYPRGYPIWRD